MSVGPYFGLPGQRSDTETCSLQSWNADLVVSPAVHGGLGMPGLAGGSLAPAAVWVLSQTLCHWLIWFSCWLIFPFLSGYFCLLRVD